ncbi:Unknown protein sequence [Pseudomonas syringae pv. maculicola str. M6]|nr:Unknown protein sequence [Pseudomonas syringae pv. maculicola str. M6]
MANVDDGFCHTLLYLVGQLAGAVHRTARVLRTAGHFFDGAFHFIHRRSRRVQTVFLLVDNTGGLFTDLRILAGRQCERVGRANQLTKGLLQGLGELVEIAAQLTEFIPTADVETHPHIATRKGFEHPTESRQWTPQAEGHPCTDNGCRQHRQQAGDQQQTEAGGDSRIGSGLGIVGNCQRLIAEFADLVQRCLQTRFCRLPLLADLLGERRFLPVGLIDTVSAGQVFEQAIDHYPGNTAAPRINRCQLPRPRADHLILQVEHALQCLNIRRGGVRGQPLIGFADFQQQLFRRCHVLGRTCSALTGNVIAQITGELRTLAVAVTLQDAALQHLQNVLAMAGDQGLRLLYVGGTELALLIKVVAQLGTVAGIGRNAVQQLIEARHAVVERLFALVDLFGVSADQNPEQSLVGAQHMHVKLTRRPA